MTIHDFDMARFVLGEEVATVAAGSRLVDPEMMAELGDYDTVTVLLTTASGKQCVITNSRRATYGYDQRVEAFGSKGMAISENVRENNATFHAGLHRARARRCSTSSSSATARPSPPRSRPSSTRSRRVRLPRSGFDDGRLALVLAEAALQSATEGRVVHLSEIG